MNSSSRIGIVPMPTYCNPISLIVIPYIVCSSNYRTTTYFQQSHQSTSSSFNLQCEMHKALATTTEENYPVSRSPTSYTVAGEGRGLELRELPHTGAGYLAHTHLIMFCIHLVIIIRVLRRSVYSMPISIFNVLQSHCCSAYWMLT